MNRWPESFGDVTGEYGAARSGAGFVGGISSLFWAMGPDAITFLQDVLSQDVEALAPGEIARSFLLQPRGKLEALLWMLRGEDRVGLVCEASRQEETIRYLSRWRLRVDVDLAPDPREVFEVWGPAPASLEVRGGWREEDGILVAEVRNAPIRHRLVAGLDSTDLGKRGLRPVGRQVDTTLRIETGEPRIGIDVDHKTIPQESGLVPEAVSFTKGCFLGQELVARIDSRGRVNRNLRGVRLLDAVIPPVGAQVTHAGKVVGTLTSVGESLAVRAPVALALIRREAPPGTHVTVSWDRGSARAVIEQLPLIGS
jgi:folate-binding protein YgfZ